MVLDIYRKEKASLVRAVTSMLEDDPRVDQISLWSRWVALCTYGVVVILIETASITKAMLGKLRRSGRMSMVTCALIAPLVTIDMFLLVTWTFCKTLNLGK